MKWLMGLLRRDQRPKPERDPEVARRVADSAELLERHRVLTKELAALEREITIRR